jgi:hypothetical protein
MLYVAKNTEITKERKRGCVAKNKLICYCSVNEGLQQKRKSVLLKAQEYRFKET